MSFAVFHGTAYSFYTQDVSYLKGVHIVNSLKRCSHWLLHRL